MKRLQLLLVFLFALITLDSNLALAKRKQYTSAVSPDLGLREGEEEDDNDMKKGYFGIALGAHIPTLSGYDPAFLYGFNAGYRPVQPIGIGFYFQRSSQDVAPGIDVSFMPMGLEGSFFFNDLFSASIQSGVVLENGSTTSASDNDIEFSIGPKFSLNYFPRLNFSIGLEPGVLVVFGEKTYGLIQIPVVAKFWF